MELSSKGSFTEYMQSKLLACEHARAGLERELSALEERWRPRRLEMEQRKAEATAVHRALKTCIDEQNKVANLCGKLEIQTRRLEDSCDELEMSTQDSKYQIEEYTTTIEEMQKNNEKMSLSLHQAEEKIKELSKMNSSLSQNLSGVKIPPES